MAAAALPGGRATVVNAGSEVSAADNAPMYLWAYGGGNSRQCQAVDEGGGAYRFVNRHSGKCPQRDAGRTGRNAVGAARLRRIRAQSFQLTPRE
ncbi:RICIN domain-containing protein [Streptomyces sp. NPDC007861]|uniref:RICIN domain-containing protein n=1 Tax=Streptomyces sp. NPDC007861 TaxID=3154893 RepID=UPI0033C83A21